MMYLLKGVTVLLLTAFASFSNGSMELPEECQVNLTVKCAQDFLTEIDYSTAQNLSQEDVESYLNTIMNLSTRVINDAADRTNLTSYGQDLLNITEKLLSKMVKKTDTYSNISFSVQNLEVQVFMVGPHANLSENLTLTTSNAAMDIDLIGISKNNNGSAAVAFISYNNMEDIFNPNFTITRTESKKTLMSALISPLLLNIMDRTLTIPANFTLKHIKELGPEAIMSCMEWRDPRRSECLITNSNRTHTVCSCDDITNLALISETDMCRLNLSELCPLYFVIHLQKNLPYELPQETVEKYLTATTNLEKHINIQFRLNYNAYLLTYANRIVVTTLWRKIDNNISLSLSLQTLDVQVFLIGPKFPLSETPRLNTSHASLDIDLIGISKTNKGSAAVMFMSYTTMAHKLEPLPEKDRLNKTIMSTLVTVNLFKSSRPFARPVNFTLKHINGNDTDHEGILSCVNTQLRGVLGLCNVTQTNSTHTVCSCKKQGDLILYMLTIPNRDNLTAKRAFKVLYEINRNTDLSLPRELVERYLKIIRNLTTLVKDVVYERNDLISFGNYVLNCTQKLASILVKKIDAHSISLQTLEIQTLAVGPNVTLSNDHTFITSHTSLDIDLIEISKDVKESATVTVIFYTSMSDILKPIFFNTTIQTNKTMMSAVVSVSLPQITSRSLTRPINITLKHINALEPEFRLSCVYWKDSEWVEGGCDIIQTNSSHTVCSCYLLATFALIMETDPCKVNLTKPCITNFLDQIPVNTAQELIPEVVKHYVNIIMKLIISVKSNTTDQSDLKYYGKAALDLNEKLLSKVVTKTETGNITITLQNLEVQVLMVAETNAPFISQLSTSNASLEIDLTGRSAAVGFMSYTNMEDILKPRFFKTSANTMKTMMSTVVSATFLKTTNTYLSKSVKFTFKHIGALDSEGNLFCVHWKGAEWVEDGCAVAETNSTHTVCSCNQMSVFALIMEIVPCKTLFGITVSLHCNSVLNMSVVKGIGVFFLTLCLLTFAFFCQNTKDTNAALINLCLNLLLFHLTDILKSLYQTHLQPPQACAVMSGIRWFFFISCFVWMLIETVLLFLLVKNLSKIRSNQREYLSMKWLNMIGYLISLAVVTLCTLLIPQNSVEEQCWENRDTEKTFDTPIIVIVATNMILYIIIIIIMIFTLKRLKNENLHRSNTDDKDLITRVMIKSLAQFVILGCYWIFLYIPDDTGVLYNTFLFLNSQQGTFIFLIHCLLNQEVRHRYRKFVCAFFCFKKLDTITQIMDTQQ
ncbi:uncharacterized protein LOC131346566 [Hemibagrus wyckioides]|uniref:uncharacterized protein LOC131346566 n=1 Tax=Hemibagrus wyckioides TaxID=337641 RepID=UPI00266B637A|nr:uncharacterized protein LOC131346566 [Hemibagrus wyckioides]